MVKFENIKKLLFFLLLLILANSINAQHRDTSKENTNKLIENAPIELIYEIETGYFIGGSGTVYFFTYNAALGLSFATGWELQDDVTLLGAVAIEKNLEGTLFPVTANLKKHFGKSKNQFATIQAGFAFGSGENENSGFNYGNGLVAGLSYGLNLLHINNAKIYAQLGYKLRRTNLSFTPFIGSDSVNNILENHFVAFQVGVTF